VGGGPGDRWNVNVAFISLQVRLAVPELAALAMSLRLFELNPFLAPGHRLHINLIV
jgi:hypothetical protein